MIQTLDQGGLSPTEGTRVSLVACGKTFADGTRALDPVTLEIAGGETLVLLGPSGCGKTTLLRIIAGLESPDAGGKVLFNGEDVTPRPIEKREVGMVFQSYALFPNMTVAENVAYGPRMRRMAKGEIAARVDEMLAMMHIADLADRRITQLSGGQRQRVALARAIAARPRVLLLDEPLTALDALLRERLRGEINDLLRGLGITAVYVTHDQAEAMALGDRVVVMDKGHVAQVGTPRAIYHAPATDFVADFVGTVNRLTGPLAETLRPGAGPLLTRPEDLEVVPPDEASFSARVVSVLFLGNRARIQLVGPEGLPLVMEASSRLEVSVGGDLPLRVRAGGLMTLGAEVHP